MKRLTILLTSAVFFQMALAQKNIEGNWHGSLSFSGNSLRLVLHLKNQNGNYSATLDSPDQGAIGIEVSNVVVKGDSLVAEVAAVGGKISGWFLTDSTFTGQWQQGMSLPLDLKKLTGDAPVTTLRRPQTPKPPFPYSTADVLYYNNDKSIRYGATVTSPEGKGPFPAILLITGSGAQNRDEELFGHKPFAVLADYLTRQGYVVLRVDDRGVGQTTGPVKNATSKDFAIDAMVGLDYLKTLPQVDRSKLGLLGHSEGGMIAQIVAAEKKEIGFVIMMAGPGQKIVDLMVEQNKAVLTSNGMQPKAIAAYLELYRSFVNTIVYAPTDTTAKLRALAVLINWIKRTPKDIVASTTGITSEEDKKTFIDAFVKEFRSPWFFYFIKYDPSFYIKKMKARVLALNGEKDIQVVPKQNLAALKNALQKSGSQKFDLIEIKGVNHLFQQCNKCTVAEYGELEETIAPKVLDTIGQWLKQNVK